MHELNNELELDFRIWLSHIGDDLCELADLADLAETLETARGDDYTSALVAADELADEMAIGLAKAIKRTISNYFDLLPF